MFRKSMRLDDPARSWTAFYSARGDLDGSYQLHNEVDGQYVTVLTDQLPMIQNGLPSHFRRLPLPPDLRPGSWSLLVNGQPRYVNLAVAAPAESRGGPVTLQPAGRKDAENLQKAVEKTGFVTLSAGVYWFDRPIVLPDDTVINAFGARLMRSPSGDPDDYGERMFVPGHNCSLYGGELYPVYLVWHNNPAARGLYMAGTVVHGGALGWGLEEACFDQVEFDNCRVEFAPPGLYYRCRWSGTPSGSNAFVLQGGHRPGAYAVADCRFDATDRGPVVNVNAGPFRGNIFHGLLCRDLVRGENGNEVVMAEGGYGVHDFSDNLVSRLRALRCSSGVFQLWDCPAYRNVCTDLEVDGSSVVWLAGWGGVEVAYNEVSNFELRNGARIQCGVHDNAGNLMSGNVHDNKFVFGGVVNYSPGRQNQPSWPSMYAARPAASSTFADGNNTLAGVSMANLCPGSDPVVGMACDGVTCDGKVVIPKIPVG